MLCTFRLLQKISIIFLLSVGLGACSNQLNNVAKVSNNVTEFNEQILQIDSSAKILNYPLTLSQPSSKRRKNFKEIGLVSYYGDSLNGHKTASGEVLDNKKFTAAHKRLPFGSYVRVTALWNGRSVVVRINDRGPYPKGRIIDISKAAATKIGLVGKGIGQVEIEVINK